MILDISRYRHAVKPIIKYWLERNTHQTIREAIPSIAIATNCPILAVTWFVEELTGPSELLESLKRLYTDFYKIEGVIGTL